MAAKFYEPTEYEKMLIAAGWVTIESLDDDYLKYQQFAGCDDAGYESWKGMVSDLDSLSEQYQSEIQPLYDTHEYDHSGLPFKDAEQEKYLLKQMGFLEEVLGY